MVLIQLDLPPDIDKLVKFYMVEKNLNDKKVAVLELLRGNIKKKKEGMETSETTNGRKTREYERSRC